MEEISYPLRTLVKSKPPKEKTVPSSKVNCSKEELAKLTYELGTLTAVGEKFGVSANAVVKQAKKMGLPHRTKELKE